MKTAILCAALALAFVACDAKVTVPADRETTVINPPGEKKETTIINPAPKSETSTSTTPAGTSTATTETKR